MTGWPTLNPIPLWGLTQSSETDSWIPSWVCHQLIFVFLSKSLICLETPWNNIRFTWQDSLTFFRDPDFLFIVIWMSQSSESIWNIFFISLPQGIYFIPDRPPPVGFEGKDAEALGPGSCPLLHLCQGKDQHWADLPGLGQKRRLWKPHVSDAAHCPFPPRPQLPPAPPPPPPALFLSEPQRQCPSELLGTEVRPLHWPRLPHTRTFRHQWETARSVGIAPFFRLWGPHSPRPSVPFHLSGQCCFLKPAILPPLSPPLPPPLLLCSHPFYLSSFCPILWN